MNSRGFFSAYNGMLNIASRRDDFAVKPAARRRKRGLAARLLRLV